MSTADPTNLAELLARVEAIRHTWVLSPSGEMSQRERDLLAAHDALRDLVGRLGEGLRDGHVHASGRETCGTCILIAEAEAVMGKGVRE